MYLPLFLVAICAHTLNALPIKDSPINTIVIPYEPYVSQQIINSRGQLQRVLVPVNLDFAPRVDLKKGEFAMGSKGARLNFAEGAYPVYYMPGSANGKFNGKITLLK